MCLLVTYMKMNSSHRNYIIYNINSKIFSFVDCSLLIIYVVMVMYIIQNGIYFYHIQQLIKMFTVLQIIQQVCAMFFFTSLCFFLILIKILVFMILYRSDTESAYIYFSFLYLLYFLQNYNMAVNSLCARKYNPYRSINSQQFHPKQSEVNTHQSLCERYNIYIIISLQHIINYSIIIYGTYIEIMFIYLKYF